jgi:signal transduction histidine kinase
MSPIDEETPPAREVRRQVKRIRRKARELRSEAERAGAVYNGLDTKSELLAADASELAERLFMLRGVARDVRREFGNPARPDGVPHESPDPQVQGAVQKAQQAQKRLDELLSRNRSAQHRCLAQIERIEDLLDMARLEIACPEDSAPADTGREELVQEVETELEAARRAIEEVQQQSELA